MKPSIWIIGYGNLGYDLVELCKAGGFPHALTSRAKSYYSENYEPKKPAMIINTIGGHIETDTTVLWDSNIKVNQNLSRQYSGSVVVALSSNAALEPWRSQYGATKKALEECAGASANLYVMRVSTLYGSHKTERNFPTRLRRNHPRPSKLSLPSNPIQPTPTRWLAQKILQCEFLNTGEHVHDIAPKGVTSPADWARKFLPNTYVIIDAGPEPTRPNFRLLKGTGPSWSELWSEHGIQA